MLQIQQILLGNVLQVGAGMTGSGCVQDLGRRPVFRHMKNHPAESRDDVAAVAVGS